MDTNAALFLFLSVTVTVIFSFVAVVLWTTERRKEREAYYRHETIKKLSESAAPGAVIEFLRETDRVSARRLRGALRLAGPVVASAGIGVMIFLKSIGGPVYLAGVIPLCVGVALFVYGQFMASRD